MTSPEGLRARGEKLWGELQAEVEFDPHEAALLLEVCRTLDTIDALAAAVTADGVMIPGSQGQQVLNPAVAELRQQQASYARLMTAMNLTGVDAGTTVLRATSVSARVAANARWAKVKGADRATTT